MSFDTIASEIIQESIKSAIFIDDEVKLPFEKDEDENLIDHSDLYNTFRDRHCSLSFFRFEDNWRDKESYLFDNRDLLILDWQLTGSEPKFVNALHILEKAIQKESLHFCSIYTKVVEKNFEDLIILKILYYFNWCIPFYEVDITQVKDLYIEACEEEGLNYEELFSNLGPRLKELILYWNDQKIRTENFKETIDIIRNNFSSIRSFQSKFSSLFSELITTLIAIFFSFENFDFPVSEKSYPIRISRENNQWRLYLNDSIILITNKNTIKNNVFYDTYKSYLVQEKNIFLTILGLEIRNRFRKSSGFIGKELNEISQIAFFSHHKNIKEREFYEFLKQIWLDQASSIFYEGDFQLLSAIEDYMKNYGVEKQIEEFENKLISNENHQKDLMQLNSFYNILRFKPSAVDKISFGDIFKSDIDGKETYFICITPLCDCVNPNKIKNQYIFVMQEVITNNYFSALKNAESQHVSFLKKNGNYYCINWGKCKPFTLYIKEPILLNPSEIIYQESKIKFEFICRIKEKYAQRIANKSANYPLRVGVSFAQIREEET